ncbi:MAG: histidinol-phosphate transaminase [Cytophagaceae bacterium]|nr:histidinol-phosphate transaminase [Cytophagaceae bacterium]MDW8456681.1 histidinol-phosphate transaminase [Cytophagaceae bacterium]
MFSINSLLRPNISRLTPYSSARDEYKGREGIFLDANENPIGSPLGDTYNRYPDPLQVELKNKIAEIKNVHPAKIFLGNGSDEPIDILIRMLCTPASDAILIAPPTYGMYEVSAHINDAKVIQVPLTQDYQLDVEAMLNAVTPHTKIIFLCSPNNPTGNCMDNNDIEAILKNFSGLVVIDEAYTDFAPEKSLLPKLGQYPNMVILQTFSKAWGLAGLRLGMAFASEDIIQVMNKVKPPYNINSLTQKIAQEVLNHSDKKNEMVNIILRERSFLKTALEQLMVVDKVFPSDANFLLVKMKFHAKKIYNYLIAKKIITRDRSNVILCENSLRITVGTHEENQSLISALQEYIS